MKTHLKFKFEAESTELKMPLFRRTLHAEVYFLIFYNLIILRH